MKFKTILADPPWKYSNFKSAANGAPQYQTMTYEELKVLPVSTWADKDCLLVMWATWPLLPQAVALMRDWEFEYISGWPWIKTLPKVSDISTGIGFWSQSASELCILGRKGKVSPPKVSKQLGLMVNDPAAFYAPVSRKHSRKPMGIHEWIETNFKGPHLEIFATQFYPGWTCWGADLGHKITSQGVETI